MGKTIKFKSTPDNWRNEYLGLKKNTVRRCDDPKDIRFEILNDYIFGTWNIISIEIENTTTSEVFIRTVTDVSMFEGFYIISWG